MDLKPNLDIRNFNDLHREMQKKAARELIAFGVFFLVAIVVVIVNA
jgi:predicted nucleic acid-binding Zn ribbon protein